MSMRTYYLILLFLWISSITFGQNDKKVFIMVHFESGRDTTHPLINEILFDELGYPPDSLTTNSLYFQQVLWPAIVNMIQTADSFNIKLTLALQSQMAEYILQDEGKISLMYDWVQNGHELAVHHHGINHVDWGGYTNRFQGTVYPDDHIWEDKFLNSGLYRGNMQQGFNYLQQLASEVNDSVVTGCITDTQIDKPDAIVYLTEGGDPNDLISIPDTITLPFETFYFLSHCQLLSFYKKEGEIIEDDIINHELATERLNLIKDSLNQVSDDEIMGIVFHAFDYYRFPDIYRDLFSFFNQSQVNSKSIRELMSGTTGIENNSYYNNISIYPNPTTGIVNINYSTHDTKLSLRVFDIYGKIIMETYRTDQIDLNNNKSGIYFVQIVSSSNIVTERIILQ